MRVLDTATRIAAKDVTALVRGETGTGEELKVAVVTGGSSGRRRFSAPSDRSPSRCRSWAS